MITLTNTVDESLLCIILKAILDLKGMCNYT